MKTILLAICLTLAAAALSACGGCYERTPDGHGITACSGKSW